ncbi:MAG: hypothetical protein JW990_03360 [Thermoleophilia bacterium]|nr:hypothetical protein [Thermoleophilia bacterium]
MSHSYEDIVDWLDGYFRAVNDHQGAAQSVVKLREYFSEDLEFRMHTAAESEFMSAPLTRQQLLISFVHPGLVERITPNYYVIDTRTMKAVVQFSIVFGDETTGREWPAKEASAHYHLSSDAEGRLQIATIRYWTEIFGDEFRPMFEQWERGRGEVLAEVGPEYFA